MTIEIKKQIVSDNVVKLRSYGKGNKIKKITIHQTDNFGKGANAQSHANLQSRLNPRQASWHYTVDDKEIIQSFEDNIMCWHCTDGRGPGNTTSVGIEICVNSDGNYKKAIENAVKLVQYLIKKYNLTVNDVVQHNHWYPKNCPSQIRAGREGITWAKFIKMVKEQDEEVTKTIETKPKQQTNAYIGKRVESKVSGLRYYNKPSWDDKDVVGKVDKGVGFPTIVDKVKVGSAYQYKVKNSKGAIFYITASPTYVNVVENKKANLQHKPVSKPKTHTEKIKGLGVLREGNQGSGVLAMQQALSAVYFYPDKKAKNNGCDGIYGNKTVNCVKRFQSFYGLVQDGIFGAKTKAKLIQALGGK